MPSIRKACLPVLLLCLFGALVPARAELQFDVFFGYDNIIREASWFPVACEVYNDGPSFNAVVELTSGRIGTEQVRRVPLEFPTNTRKRFVIPVFAAGGRFAQWNARLLDERGRVLAERSSLQPRVVAWEGKLLGALSKAFAGIPVLPNLRQNRPDLKPQVARLQVEQFPDNPIALEGLDALYLNSERALSLKVNQVAALLAWVREGNHLIVAVEQLADVNSTPWLQQLLPAEVNDMVNVQVDEALQEWVRKGAQTGVSPAQTSARSGRRPAPAFLSGDEIVSSDPNFFGAEMPVATGRLRDGQVLLAAKGRPLIIQATRGRGEVTLLTFSPEREPFRSWKNRPWFWSQLLGVAPGSYSEPTFSGYGGLSLDGVFGALIDSRQMRKLPVEWLLLLLVAYLVVIGPFDQWWLKKINRQMLTWITFPTYVVFFSLLIYFIGYKLRAGETEWNELTLLDVLPGGQKAVLRGRTYASIYSSSNAKYQLAFTPPEPEATDQSYASLRGEMLDLYSGGNTGSRADVEYYGNAFRAEIFVPVWTSLLYVNDWMQPGPPPLAASVSNQNEQWQVTVENLLGRDLTETRVVVNGFVHELGTLPARQRKTYTLDPSAGVPLQSFVLQHSSNFQSAMNYRRSALGRENQADFLDNPPLAAMAASFIAQIPQPNNQRGYVTPPGLDLTSLIDDHAILLAWDAENSFANPINRFKPPRLRRQTLLRLAVPLNPGQPRLEAGEGSGGENR